MGLLDLLAGIPVNANLRLHLEAFARESVETKEENSVLKRKIETLESENSKLKDQIAELKKPKGIYQVPTKRVGGQE